MNKLKKSFCFLGIFLLFLSSFVNVSALTGTLKTGSRMVVPLEPGESIRKYITVQNTNNASLTIDISVSGDLYKSIELEEKNFVLEPGQEKKVYFTVTADKPGTTETRLNVRFTPDKGNGVGLTSTIIVVTKEQDNYFDTVNLYNNKTDFENLSADGVNSGFSLNPSGVGIEKYTKGFKFTPIIMLAISSVLLVLVFIGLVIYSNKKRKKKVRRASE